MITPTTAPASGGLLPLDGATQAEPSLPLINEIRKLIADVSCHRYDDLIGRLTGIEVGLGNLQTRLDAQLWLNAQLGKALDDATARAVPASGVTIEAWALVNTIGRIGALSEHKHSREWMDEFWPGSRQVLLASRPAPAVPASDLSEARKYADHLMATEQFQAWEIVDGLIKALSAPPAVPASGVEYLRGLKPGERVIETGQSGTRGWTGTVYEMDQGRGPGVRWDAENGGEPRGVMCTSVTHGTRRIRDVLSAPPAQPAGGWVSEAMVDAALDEWLKDAKGNRRDYPNANAIMRDGMRRALTAALAAANASGADDPDLGKIGPGHVCKHHIRWPHPCRECDDAAYELRKANASEPKGKAT